MHGMVDFLVQNIIENVQFYTSQNILTTEMLKLDNESFDIHPIT